MDASFPLKVTVLLKLIHVWKFVMYNNMYPHLPGKCILLVVNTELQIHGICNIVS